MARLNVVHMKGILPADPLITHNEANDYHAARIHLVVARDTRKVENGEKYMKTDRPIILTSKKEIVDQAEKLKRHDIVYIKGVISTRLIHKSAHCPNCGEENHTSGVVTYVTPIAIEKTGHVDNDNDGIAYLSQQRSTSNEVHLYGRLTRDPKKVSPKSGLVVTQYQIAINRNYIVPNDPPEARTDYPWVKSYGEAAEEDRFRLMEGSIVLIDGYLQTRPVKKHMQCEFCGEKYDRDDKAMEIVPYDTEYVIKFRSDEEIAAEKKRRADQAWFDTLGEDEITREDVALGMDDFSES